MRVGERAAAAAAAGRRRRRQLGAAAAAARDGARRRDVTRRGGVSRRRRRRAMAAEGRAPVGRTTSCAGETSGSAHAHHPGDRHLIFFSIYVFLFDFQVFDFVSHQFRKNLKVGRYEMFRL